MAGDAVGKGGGVLPDEETGRDGAGDGTALDRGAGQVAEDALCLLAMATYGRGRVTAKGPTTAEMSGRVIVAQ